MTTHSLADRIEAASCSIDGVAAFLMDLVQSPDLQVSRMAYAMGDLLQRLGGDLDEVALEVKKLTPEEAFREYWLWSVWPALICAGVFLLWPPWSRILERQELADPVEEAPRLEPGT